MTRRRILGIDPGSRITGIGIVETDGQHSRHIYSGCLRLGDRPLPERLGEIFTGISDVIRTYAPDEMSIEEVFMATNAAAALKLGQARGAAICAGVTLHLPVHEYSAREVKQAIVGKGNADKMQVQHMVKILLNLQGSLQIDASDALAIALCHAHTSHLTNRINKVIPR